MWLQSLFQSKNFPLCENLQYCRSPGRGEKSVSSILEAADMCRLLSRGDVFYADQCARYTTDTWYENNMKTGGYTSHVDSCIVLICAHLLEIEWLCISNNSVGHQTGCHLALGAYDPILVRFDSGLIHLTLSFHDLTMKGVYIYIYELMNDVVWD